MASSTLWVTKRMEERRAAQMRISSICINSRVWASMLAKGSSMSNTLGSQAKARASATRCFMPPESSPG